MRPDLNDAELKKFEGYVAEIFTALGMDLSLEGTRDTPRRYLRALIDVTEGLAGDPNLIKIFETECRTGNDCRLSQVIKGPISFYSLCEHHALPFFGRAWVGYVAHEHLIGLSKLTRLVRVYSKRFTMQERLGRQIADALVSILQPHGVAVLLEAHHLCYMMRGVSAPLPLTHTTVFRGEYEGQSTLRSEFLTCCIQGGGLHR